MYSQMKKLALGFRLVFIGMVLIATAILGLLVGTCITMGLVFGAGNGGLQAAGLMMILMVGMILLVLCGAITTLIGEFFCLAVPNEVGTARGMIVFSIALEFAAIGLWVVSSVVQVMQIPLQVIFMFALSAGELLCYFGSIIFFLLFTRTVAEYFDRRDLADTAMSVLWLWVLTVALNFAWMGIMSMGGMAGAAGGGVQGMAFMGCIGLAILLVSLILSLINFFRFMGLMRDMSDATLEYAGGIQPRRRRKPKRKKQRLVEEEEAEDDENDEDDEDEERRRRDRDRFRF